MLYKQKHEKIFYEYEVSPNLDVKLILCNGLKLETKTITYQKNCFTQNY